MAVYQLDPILDPRWRELVARDIRASVFHSPEWLSALARTYDYVPVVLTTSAPDRELDNGIVFCHINSWLTGRRMVSLPFSDHCEPLVNTGADFNEIMGSLDEVLQKRRLRSAEIRPLTNLAYSPETLSPVRTFCFHKLDLRPSADELMLHLHKDCIRRKIRRAERETLKCRQGTDPGTLKEFYRLFVMTRKRHGLPPSPFRWLQTLASSMGSNLSLRVATKEGRPIAGVLTLTHKDCVYYKYAASDPAFHNMGAIPFLLWNTILEAKSKGVAALDMGRCNPDSEGLITFKNRWGANKSQLTYWSAPGCRSMADPRSWKLRMAKFIFSLTPAQVRISASDFLYKHVG